MTAEPTAPERFIRGILPENPTYRQLLGLCPTLAVTNNMKSALTMAGAVLFVLFCANVMVSLIRNLLKPHLRIVAFTLVIAAFVTIVDRLLAAYMYTMSKNLGPYIPLIIVNCIIIGRCEICASKESVLKAASDAIGQSIGFGIGLSSIAFFREIIGTGMVFGTRVLPQIWPDWVIMILPPGAFFTFGLLLGSVNYMVNRKNTSIKNRDSMK
ncbi:MAG: electron transport complex subunit RsxE [Proteobacteria bacterium]|nr:electron transport complex subunit RsxE [Pseudomonadota bacterium]